MASIFEQLKLHEGLRLKPYKCSAGKWTIGVGHNYQDTGLPDWLKHETLIIGNNISEWTDRLSKAFTSDMAERLLNEDVAKYESQIIKKMPKYEKLDAVRKKVVLDMTFNMGVGWIDKFENTVTMINVGDYIGAANGMMNSAWAKQVGKRAQRLANMMRTGVDYDEKGGFGG